MPPPWLVEFVLQNVRDVPQRVKPPCRMIALAHLTFGPPGQPDDSATSSNRPCVLEALLCGGADCLPLPRSHRWACSNPRCLGAPLDWTGAWQPRGARIV